MAFQFDDEEAALNAAIAASLADAESSASRFDNSHRSAASGTSDKAGAPSQKKKSKVEESGAGSDDDSENGDVAGSDDMEFGDDSDIDMLDPINESGEDLEEAEDEDEDYGGSNDEFEGFDDGPKALEGPPFELLTRDDIIARQRELIDKVSDFLGLNSSSSRALLQHCRWEPEKVFTLWTEDSAGISKKVGIDPATATGQSVKGKNIAGECLVCMEDSELYQLSCGHGYCYDCWKGYLSVHISERKSGITCPAPKCGRILDEMIIMKLAGDEKLRKKFDEALVASFVENNPLVRWCPAPNCGRAVLLREIHSERNEIIKCDCGHFFCFRCGEESHAPAFCDMQKEWKTKNEGGDDALNEKFLATISRPCPSCKNPIEKNGGCNHMSCSKCGFHFCWQCMSKFGGGAKGGSDGYTTHKCNTFYEEDSKLKLDKEDWERFRWYAERFNNHLRSRKFESEKLHNSDSARHLMQEQTAITWQASSFYAQAMDQLVQNRQILMWSYVFGFFRPIKRPEINKQLFEHRQNEFERHTEILSKWFDNGIEEEADSATYIANNRLQIINDTKLCQNSMSALLDVAANAFEPDRPGLRSSGSFAISSQGSSSGRSLKKSGGPRGRRAAPPSLTDEEIRQREENDRRARREAELEREAQLARERERKAARDAERERARLEEEEQLKKAMEASLNTVEPDEEELLRRAIAESMKGTPAPAMTDEEREFQEALRLSLLESNN